MAFAPAVKMAGSDELEQVIAAACAAHLPAGADFAPGSGFFEAGLTSKALSVVMVELKEQGIPVTLLDFFKYHNAAALAAELSCRRA